MIHRYGAGRASDQGPRRGGEVDEANVIWAMQDRVISPGGGPSLTGYGHYHERWVKRNGRWKIAALKLTRLHLDFHPPTQK